MKGLKSLIEPKSLSSFTSRQYGTLLVSFWFLNDLDPVTLLRVYSTRLSVLLVVRSYSFDFSSSHDYCFDSGVIFFYKPWIFAYRNRSSTLIYCGVIWSLSVRILYSHSFSSSISTGDFKSFFIGQAAHTSVQPALYLWLINFALVLIVISSSF